MADDSENPNENNPFANLLARATHELSEWPTSQQVNEAWLDLLTDELREARGAELQGWEPPTLIVGIDPFQPVAYWRPATLSEIAAIGDPNDRAHAVYANGIRGHDNPEAAAVIRSCIDGGVEGTMIQANLQPPPKPTAKLVRRFRTHWTRRRAMRVQPANLFEVFEIDTNTKSEGDR